MGGTLSHDNSEDSFNCTLKYRASNYENYSVINHEKTIFGSNEEMGSSNSSYGYRNY
jgi:hypothetical protein